MKILIELSALITRKKVNRIELLTKSILSKKNSKFQVFYNSLQDHKFKNDRDAAKYLYNETPNSDKYRQLKSRFRKKLLNTAFFIDTNQIGSGNYEKAFIYCQKQWALIQILQENQATQTVKYIASKTLTVGQKYNFSEIIFNCSRILRKIALFEKNFKEFDNYDYIFSKSQVQLNNEILSENYLLKAQKILHPQFISVMNVSTVKTMGEALILISEKYNNEILNYNMNKLWVLYYKAQEEYENVQSILQSSIKNLNIKNMNARKIFELKIELILVKIARKDWESGQKLIIEFIENYKKNKSKVLILNEYYFILAVHCQQYVLALAIYYKQQKVIKSNAESIFWTNAALLIELLFAINKIPTDLKEKKKRTPHKITPRFSNSNNLIITWCNALLKKDLPLSKQITLQFSKHLKKGNPYSLARNSFFLNLMKKMEKKDFDPTILNTNLNELQQELSLVPIFYNSSNNLELIPFEDLIEMIFLQILPQIQSRVVY